MKFLLDENLPISLKSLFEIGDNEVISIREEYRGIKDKEIWKIACENRMVIITRDLDFPLFKSNEFPEGLILIRVPYFYTAQQIINLMREFLGKIEPDKIKENIVVVSPGQIRIRKLSNIQKG